MRVTWVRAAPWALLIAVGSVGAGAAASGQNLPPGREVVARHARAVGGEDGFRNLTSLLARGRWEIPAQRLVGVLEVQSARPNRLLYRVTVAGIGLIEHGFDGAVGWSRSPLTGPELLTGRQLIEAADEASFDSALHLPSLVPDATTLGIATFDGRSAYRVRIVFQSGNEQIEFFDVDSGLQIGSEAVRATPQGDVPTVDILRDYQACGPILQPATIIQRALGFEQIVTITSCEVDVVAADVFGLPADVEALVAPVTSGGGGDPR